MINVPLDKVSYEILEELRRNRTSESATLDFKQQLPGVSDKDKHEFLKDACALANAEGGDLIYGIAEGDDGVAGDIVPITVESDDAAMRRLRQLLTDRVEPVVHGVHMHRVDCPSGGYVLIVRVPKSFEAPHRFLTNGSSRFPIRNERSINEMSFDQLRSAFSATSTLADRAASFRETRSQHSRRFMQGPLTALYLIPLSAMSGRSTIDVQHVFKNTTSFSKEWGGQVFSTYNLDGVLTYDELVQHRRANYAQIHRSGAIEIADTDWGHGRNGNKLPAMSLAKFYREAAHVSLAASTGFGFSGPALLGVELLNVLSYSLEMQPLTPHRRARPSDREDIVLPLAWIEDMREVDVDKLMAQQMDVLWQAFNIPSCAYFSDGKWNDDLRYR